jgi:phosphatidylglycerophosphatase A
VKRGFLTSVQLSIAQGFGSGLFPVAPGTAGTFVGYAWFLLLISTGSWTVFLTSALASIGLSVWAAQGAEKILKQKDPSSVVIDEIIAVPFCYVGWLCWKTDGQPWPPPSSLFQADGLLISVAGIALFRLFDIWKPWPVRQSQSLPGGWGVTIDDVLAAGYVNIVLLVFLKLRG